jgi:hypothetical protein
VRDCKAMIMSHVFIEQISITEDEVFLTELTQKVEQFPRAPFTLAVRRSEHVSRDL